MITKEQIREYIYGLGLCEVGFTDARPFDQLERVIKERRDRGYLSGFEKGTDRERCRPGECYDWVRSIISVACPYTLYRDGPSDSPAGTISGSAVGGDYHRLLREKLEQAARYISEKEEGFRYEIMVDTGPLADREVACRSGIGWFGKNCSIITPASGSAVVLGEMLTNVELEPDSPKEGECGECNRCIENCPTGALVAPYTLDASRCISCLTQKRGIVPLELRDKMGVSIYGCDRCLAACPHNRGVLSSGEPPGIDLEQLIRMGKKEFDRAYKQSAFGWRGLNVLKRNAVIALGNLRARSGLAALQQALRSPSAVIRGHAAWAVGRIGGEKAKGMLEEALSCEKDGYVRGEILAALGGLRK
jgi:epoxyqueuosine reductase